MPLASHFAGHNAHVPPPLSSSPPRPVTAALPPLPIQLRAHGPYFLQRARRIIVNDVASASPHGSTTQSPPRCLAHTALLRPPCSAKCIHLTVRHDLASDIQRTHASSRPGIVSFPKYRLWEGWAWLLLPTCQQSAIGGQRKLSAAFLSIGRKGLVEH